MLAAVVAEVAHGAGDAGGVAVGGGEGRGGVLGVAAARCYLSSPLRCGVITALPEAGGGAVAGGPGEEVGGLGVWAAVEAAVAATVGGGVAATLHLGSCGL